MGGGTDHSLDEASGWALLLALARRAGAGSPVRSEVGLRVREDGTLEEGARDPWIVAQPTAERGWAWAAGATVRPELTQLFDLYMPLCVEPGCRDLTIAHLAQTLDGRIAIASGKSQFITSRENLVHAHRLRALCDVVLVGRHTIREDNPRLTTRLCAGPSPVRVVIDPSRRLGERHHVFQDGAATTLLFCDDGLARAGERHGLAEVVGIEAADGSLPTALVVAELHRRGLRRIYVEGGGLTVSRFLHARTLTRLQITIAPLLFGSGLPAITLPQIEDLASALPLSWRTFAIGPDVLFDCTVAR